MGKIRKFFSLVPVLVLWLMLSVLVWGFVFTRITDTDPAHKITLFVDSEVTDATGLAVKLEESLDVQLDLDRDLATIDELVKFVEEKMN